MRCLASVRGLHLATATTMRGSCVLEQREGLSIQTRLLLLMQPITIVKALNIDRQPGEAELATHHIRGNVKIESGGHAQNQDAVRFPRKCTV